MGLSSFPTTVSEGVLPILIINTALSFAIIKDILRSFLQMIGLTTSSSESDFFDPSWTSEDNFGGNPDAQFIAEEIRQSLPIKRWEIHSATAHLDCAVCLSGFEQGDETRELPCCHFFHRPCLDKWLDHQQTTCPLCRSCLISESTADRIKIREQEHTDEWIFWCSSFQEGGIFMERPSFIQRIYTMPFTFCIRRVLQQEASRSQQKQVLFWPHEFPK